MAKKKNGVSRAQRSPKLKVDHKAMSAISEPGIERAAADLEALMPNASSEADIVRGIASRNLEAILSFLHNAAAAIDPKMRLGGGIDHIRKIVNEDDTYPIAAKYIGRALYELGAFDESHAVSRPSIFAFFTRSGAAEVLTDTNYREVAQGCMTVSGGVYRRESTTAVDTASKALSKQMKKLEEWHCICSIKDKNGKRVASYLINHSNLVFNGWEKWPERKPQRGRTGKNQPAKS